MLLFHDGSDAVTDAGITAIETLGVDNGFGVAVSEDPADFTAANLDQYAAVVFLDADGNVLSETAQENALRNYVQGGRGFLGIGATAEAEPNSSFFDNLIGARPAEPCPPEPEPGQNCSPTGELSQVVAAGDRVHPATRDLPLQVTRTDHWYRWEQRPTGQVHTVARWHAPNDPAGDGTNVGGTDHPVSWCRDQQSGRAFYTAMGRTAASYAETEIQDHLLGAIQWTAGLVRANCKATISANYEGERLVDASSGDLTHSGESHGLSIAENGWVVYIGRGDCRTQAQRGEVAGLAGPTPRILDFADPNVGVGCGNVHIFDPAEHDGTVNSGATLAGIIPVYGDRGGGSEINGKIEAGLLGIALSPDFTETGHVYVQYFPTFNPDNPNLPGLADGDDRRRTKMQKPRISRFTIDLETKELDLSSEVVIFEYESQIYSCCHRGGGMGIDSEGNLYVTTGDSNSSGGTNGYSGNNPPPKCPMRDPGAPDQESANNDDCGELNFSYQDARRTAGSTNDYNGKMLRFNPIDDTPDGTQPEVGIGTTYELPTADSPNGPNLFDGTEGGGDLTKPEIYAMGLRNPSRLSIDPETDIPYSAWVGPDAGGPNVNQGPSTYENAAQIAQAGNYGWPYCMGNQQAYRDRLADGSLRSSNEAGFVSGGPSGSPIEGFYDCDDLVNDSPNNTGLEVLPHETGTGMDAGTARSTNVWYSRGNEGGANGCPDFPREQGPGGAPDYGAAPAQLCPYATASGATIFNGPVYRYPDATADPSVAWPEYWDGRWFLQDFGNNSVKHGLLLDPETDQDGGQPIYADSLRGVLNWGANYMDSKFAPDGSYYVQVYQGFFTTGDQAGLYRFTYEGGPDTPGADPQWQATGTPLEVQFDRGGSGGVAYEWNFGDGSPVSDDPDPVHTYGEDGPYEVTLTVTYADDETDSKTITVNPSGEDTAPPTTAIQLNGADPVALYDGPVEVTLTADDGEGSGVEVIRYSVDGGAFQAYSDPFMVFGDGEHTVEYHSRDAAGNVEETQSVMFSIEIEGGGDSCDEFNGTQLDPKWQVVNPSASNPPTVGEGHLNMPIIPGDLFGGNGTAQMVLQSVPTDASWVLTAKIAHGTIDTNGEAAGLALVNRFDPNHFAKTALQYKNDTGGGVPGVWAERVLTAESAAVNLPGDNTQFPNSGALEFEGDYGWVRFVHDSSSQEIGTWTSTDGEEFVNFGQNMPVDEYLGEPGGLRAGVFAKHDGSGDDVVQIDSFNVVLGSSDPQTDPNECDAGGGGDITPPTTTGTTEPADPDGEKGWFTSPVEVTLDAEDNEGGSGVDVTEYRFAGDEDWTAYEGPFTVGDDGTHTVQYRSIDVEGNVEATKSLNLRIDSSPPETAATVEGEGPVEVTLDAQDGPNGSGVARTEFRVDGGEWQQYVAEEVILGSESDLERWAQAGPGGLDWVEADTGIGDSVVAVEASGTSPENEGPENLFDGVAQTKWLVFEDTAWVEFELSEPVAATRYGLTSANDFSERDPMDWTFSGSNDGETWTELDQRSGEDFPERFQAKEYEFENGTAYTHFRLEVTANHGATLIQLADLLLPEAAPDPEGPGFARTFGGLGLPWYPVKEYGDFSLKMQWRDSSTGTNGNSGVFVRFPDPRIPLADRPTSGPGDWDGQYCGRTGSAATQPAWVAIYCGHEIQINDYQGDTQKTGSIYNFDPVEDPDHMPDPRGEWVDYEVRVEGQQYTIVRNGEVLNEFDNSIPLESSRSGDPPTDARQFSSGYIGLQNHGGPDVIDFRNVRVLPLDEGTVQGPIVVEGDGDHVVEFRSTDAAGNTEEIKSEEFRIGPGGGEAKLAASVKPKRKKVGPRKKKVAFRFRVTNSGDAATPGRVRLCAKAPRKRLRVIGRRCASVSGLDAGQSTRNRFALKIKRKAQGRTTRVKFIANGPGLQKRTVFAKVKVRGRR